MTEELKAIAGLLLIGLLSWGHVSFWNWMERRRVDEEQRRLTRSFNRAKKN